MKKAIFLIFLNILIGVGYIYQTHTIKNYEDELIRYDYGIKNDKFFAFYNLEIDALAWIEKYPSDFFKELAMINDKKYFNVSGWICYQDDKITSAYLVNKDLGAIYFKRKDDFTKITLKNENLLNKVIEFNSRGQNILPDNIDFSRISYETFMALPPIKYSALKEIDSALLLHITTPMTIKEIFNANDMQSLINSKWWLDSDTIIMPMD